MEILMENFFFLIPNSHGVGIIGYKYLN